ncbi:MAG: murein biosynthesis integral membrane protein MurJ [Gemmatimonadetes bacterium]|nr:murein biosynthesis integral membrane protein MurJ [Gemmatimonadota bacterium]
MCSPIGSRFSRARSSASSPRSGGWTTRASSCIASSWKAAPKAQARHPPPPRPSHRVSESTDPPRRPEGGRGARAAWLVGAGIFLSRIAGLVREMVFSFYFGNSAVADAWGAALRTPNFIQNLLGEGTLSASLIPVYARFLEEGREEEAGRFAGAALGVLTVAAFGLAVLGVLLAPLMVHVMYPVWAPEKQALTVRLVRILFPMTAVLAISAWGLGILNSHRRFFVSYVAPVLWNLAQIAGLLAFGSFLGWEAIGRDADLMVVLAVSAFIGGVLQLGIMLPWVVPVMHHFRLSVSTKVTGMADAIHNFIPVVMSRGVVNMVGLLDFILAGLLASGAIAMMRYSQMLYMLPISLFGMSIAASELPELSRAGQARVEDVRERVRGALERIMFLLIPSTLVFLVLGDVIVAGLLQHGEFGPDDTAAVYAVLAAFALGISGSAASRVLSSAFYALRDTRTPARVAYLRVFVSAAAGVTLMLPFDKLGVGTLRLGAVGLALGASIGAWTENFLLRRRLGARIGPHQPRRGRTLRLCGAGLAAAIAGLAAKAVLGSAAPLRTGLVARVLGPYSALQWPVVMAGTVLAFGVSYLAAASALQVGVPLSRLRQR